MFQSLTGLLKGLFEKKRLSEDFVEISTGKLFYKVFTKGLLDDVTNVSGGNTNLFIQLIEFELLDMKEKDIRNLSIADDKKVRAKTREILIREGALRVENTSRINEDKADIFSPQDVAWLNKAKADGLQRVGVN